MGFSSSADGKASTYNAGDLGLIPGLGRSPGEGNGNPFQYSCLENPMDGGAWWAIVHGVTRLSNFTTHYYNLSKLPEMVKGREACCALVHGVTKIRYDRVTE